MHQENCNIPNEDTTMAEIIELDDDQQAGKLLFIFLCFVAYFNYFICVFDTFL